MNQNRKTPVPPSDSSMSTPAGLFGIYVHIPFCVRKCPYCDFVSGVYGAAERQQYLEGLQWEIEHSPFRLGRACTLFFGGGTPSELSLDEISTLWEALFRSFRFEADLEATLEANPGTLNRAFLSGIRQLGFNRLSLGVQSFHDGHLRTLGRIHSASQALESYRLARQTGFDNVNIDLIFGIPGQTLNHWRVDLNEALGLAPQHLSLYSLTFEEGTDFGRKAAAGLLQESTEDLSADMFELAMELTAAAGYQHYEISNYATTGRECRHNMIYWTNEPYLGFGVSAASYAFGTRWKNSADSTRYLTGVRKGRIPRDSEERLAMEAAVGEEIMLRLRTRDGVSLDALERKYRCTLPHSVRDLADQLIGGSLLESQGDRLILTRRGKLLADEVTREFLFCCRTEVSGGRVFSESEPSQ